MGDPITGAIMAISTAASIKQQRAQEKQQKKARDAAETQNRYQAMKEQRQQIRASRIARAQILARGQAQGAAESSGVIGGMSSATSQATSNIAATNTNLSFANQISEYNQKAANAAGRASLFQTAGQVGMQLNSLYQNRPQVASTPAPTGLTSSPTPYTDAVRQSAPSLFKY